MDFEKRLEKAIERGRQTRESEQRLREEREMTEEELKQLHTRYRLELSDHIESCLRKLADYFPGFQFQTLMGEDGWGARISRDDVNLASRSAGNLYSRFEMAVRPFSSVHIVELVAKGTINNKEVLNRNRFQFLKQADTQSFREMIDLWVLEFAEKFASR
jgi:hypothetical protein